VTTGGDASCVVVDTNVLAVAEGLHPEAPDVCRAACINLAEKLNEGLVTAVDAGDEIVSEYLSALKGAASSGLGKKTAQRLFRLRRDPSVCRQVVVTPTDAPPGGYEEVPEQLRDFDTDDQKFIAVAAAAYSQPQIYTAVDGEWWDRKRDFLDAGLDLQFLCPGYFLDRDSG
jgi:hypothetical protein